MRDQWPISALPDIRGVAENYALLNMLNIAPDFQYGWATLLSRLTVRREIPYCSQLRYYSPFVTFT